MMIPVKFENVNYSISGRKIINSVNFEIPKDKITAIIGKSGSGKSTILQLINGLLKPDSGIIYLFGNPIEYNNINDLRLKMGYSVQGTSLFPHMTIEKNISLLADLNPGLINEPLNDRIVKLMKLVNLPLEYRKKYPYQLSGGEQQRVGICRAMILNPEIFLLDEAFGALDFFTKEEIHDELIRIQLLEPRTIIFVTHDLHEAFKIADYIMILNNSEIELFGSKEHVITFRENSFIRKYLEPAIK